MGGFRQKVWYPLSHVSQTSILESFPGFLRGHGAHHRVLPTFIFHPKLCFPLALPFLPAGLAHFAFRALPASTLAGSQSSVQAGPMIVMPTAGTEEQVKQFPRPLTDSTARLLCRGRAHSTGHLQVPHKTQHGAGHPRDVLRHGVNETESDLLLSQALDITVREPDRATTPRLTMFTLPDST